MIIGNEIDSLIDLFLLRNVTLFHACQLVDFKSYLRIGGVPSHAYLEKFNLPFTSLDSDKNDKKNGVWDKVFTNLFDFGETFARGWRSVPNAYGPILICIKPTALAEAMDVAICLKSAGETNFNRTREALKTVEDINKLFEYDTSYSPRSRNILKKSTTLSQGFNYPNPGVPEISCHFETGRIPLEYIEKIIVDPYIIDGQSLSEYVEELFVPFNEDANVLVCERQHNCYAWPIRKTFYSDLAQYMSKIYPLSLTLNDIAYNYDLGSDVQQWAQEIAKKDLSYQFSRYMRYFRDGTLSEFVGSKI